MRIVIVEDHALTRAGLKTTLGAEFEIVGEAADGIDAWTTLERERPDVAVVDIGLPGIDGIELTRRIRDRLAETRVVIVTMMDARREVLAALAAGADAYVLKTSEPERIRDAVRVAAEGGAYFDAEVAHVVLSQFGSGRDGAPNDTPLSPRETEILGLIADGVGNAQIAERLHIGLGTVKGHVRDILAKLSAADRTQAAVVALRRGYIS